MGQQTGQIGHQGIGLNNRLFGQTRYRHAQFKTVGKGIALQPLRLTPPRNCPTTTAIAIKGNHPPKRRGLGTYPHNGARLNINAAHQAHIQRITKAKVGIEADAAIAKEGIEIAIAEGFAIGQTGTAQGIIDGAGFIKGILNILGKGT